MSLMTQIALACTILAFLPLLVDRKRVLLNPALFVFLSVSWGVLAKALYITLFRSQPHPIVHDKIYVAAASTEFFEAGALLVLAAMAAYVAGYFLMGRRSFAVAVAGAKPAIIPAFTRKAIFGLATLTVLAFVAYLYTSGTNLLEVPLSAKRFSLRATNAPSRFQYFPYYFFKLAMLSGPLAYAIAYVLARAETKRDERFSKAAFGVVFVFALLLSHFASLRLVIALILLQIVLLLYHFRARRLIGFVSVFVLLTAASFAIITFVYRAPRDADVVLAETLAARAGPGSREDPISSIVEPRAPRIETAPPPRQGRTEPRAGNDEGSRQTEKTDDNTGFRGVAFGALNRLASGPLEGRYFLDFTKLAHIAHHFPAEQAHLLGGSVIGIVVPSFTLLAGTGSGRLTLDRYLGTQVFNEPGNSVPAGFVGELYIDFGWTGVLLGFLLLGACHRLVFNQLKSVRMPGFVVAGLVVLIPNTTLILLNSGILPAASRSVIGIGVLALVCLPSIAERRALQRVVEGKRQDEAGRLGHDQADLRVPRRSP